MTSASTEPRNGADPHRLSIAVLSITAVVLLVGIFVVGSVQQTALAIGQLDRGGDYIMVTVQFNGNTEYVVVTDAAVEKMIAYGWNPSSRRIDMFDFFDLKRIRGQEVDRQPPRNRGRG